MHESTTRGTVHEVHPETIVGTSTGSWSAPSPVANLFDTSDFPARWHCGRWTDLHGWTHIVSDALVFGAYMAIPLALVFFVRRRNDLPKPFPSVFWLFGAFIVACGLTHLNEAIIFWSPIYRFAGLVKAFTAAVSWLTFAALVPAIPKALALRSPQQLEREVERATGELRKERDTAAQLAAIVESCRDAILGLDPEGNIKSCNPATCDLLGHSTETLIGKHISWLSAEATSPGQTLTRLALLQSLPELEAAWRHADGSSVRVSVRVSPLCGSGGALQGASVIAQDLTQHLKDLANLRAAQEQLKSSVDDLERSNHDLEQFAYVASHDLQEPLRMVSSYVQLLEQHVTDLDEEAKGYMAHARDGARRMKQLIDDLLAYSRVVNRGAALQQCSLGDALDAALRDLDLMIHESQATIVRGALPTVLADAAQLQLVFQNLVHNALKFRGEEPPRIAIDSTQVGGKFQITVRDNGIGFAAGQAEKIFLMFQRLHGRGHYPGNGIGLAIAKRIIERHGGRIWATNDPNGGAAFSFLLLAPPKSFAV